MEIKGWEKISLLDFPGGICSTLFFGGCNFRCPYCHNRELVLEPQNLPTIPAEEVLNFLRQRSSFLDAVCLSGGEPTLQEELPFFLAEIKKLGLKVKLDTNGTRPGVIRKLLEAGLLDYVALDLKAPFDKYPSLTGTAVVDPAEVKETVDFLKNCSFEHEFRTTVVPELLREEDILDIAREIAGGRLYVLQQFHPRSTMIDPSLFSLQPYSREKIAQVAHLCQKFLQKVHLRGF